MIHNPVQEAIQHTKNKIPLKLIKLAIDSHKSVVDPFNKDGISSIESDMEKYVIKTVVKPKCDIEGGKIKECMLYQSMVIPTENRESDLLFRRAINTVYRIPPEEREGRDISKVISVRYKTMSGIDPLSPYSVVNGSSALINQARSVLGGQTNSDVLIPPTVELLGTDIVRLATPIINHINWVLQFQLAYPDNFFNIERSSWSYFSDMVLYATQEFIWNNLVIEIDQAAMRSGVPIGSIRDLVYEYKDAHEKFEIALNGFIATERFDEKYQMEMFGLMV